LGVDHSFSQKPLRRHRADFYRARKLVLRGVARKSSTVSRARPPCRPFRTDNNYLQSTALASRTHSICSAREERGQADLRLSIARDLMCRCSSRMILMVGPWSDHGAPVNFACEREGDFAGVKGRFDFIIGE